MASAADSADGYAIGDQRRAAEIKAALDRAAAADTKAGARKEGQGDTYGKGTGRGGCSK